MIGIILFLVAVNLAIGSEEVSAGVGGTTPPNFTVAFIGDQSINGNAERVLQMIKDEGADMVLHQGDLGYNESSSSTPDNWNNQLNRILGPDFPYFVSVGNHDVGHWSQYKQIMVDRLNRIEGATCEGDYGVQASCYYNGLFFILSGVGTLGSGHEAYLRDQLAQDDSALSVCSWHKNQAAMQTGGKGNSVGWGAYEECRDGGALIMTAHEHQYSRTKTLVSTTSQTVHPDWPDRDQLLVGPGSTFVTVSGLAGASIRNQQRCQPTSYPYGCNGEWASIETSTQGATHGALFITFHVDGQPNKARGYFKNINGEIIDTFEITSGFTFDDTPPTTPDGLTGVAASDPDSDVASYNVYRDGQLVGNALNTSYSDSGLVEDTGYFYTVAAINGGGLEGSPSDAFPVSTLPDTSPPAIEDVVAEGDSTRVEVIFNEVLDFASAETATNYAIDNGVSVSGAALQPDGRTVDLTTSAMLEDVAYTLTVQNIQDQANSPNILVSAQHAFSFIALDPSLVGYWPLDDASGNNAKDLTKYGNHGTLRGNPAWGTGQFDGALDFEGNGDAVQVTGSSTLNNLDAFTVSLWFYADTTGQSKLGRFYSKSGAFDVRFSNYDARIYVEAPRWGSKGHWRFNLDSGNLLSQWYHLAVTYDYSSASNEPIVYLNGFRIFNVDLLESASGSLSSDSGDIFIGNKPSLSGSFDGRLDDVRLYNRILGEAEVITLANGGTPDLVDPRPTPEPTFEPTEPTPTPFPLASTAPTVETDQVPSGGDAADDPAIWIHPADPSQSVIIGTDKTKGIGVYDLAGNQLQFLSHGKLNNVDLRYNFPLGGQPVTLVTAGNRSNDSIAVYRLNPATRRLENVAARTIGVGIGMYGSCMYHSPVSGKYYFMANAKDGKVEQWELFENGNGKVDGTRVRNFDVGGITEGCVSDDEMADFYIGEEDVAIWKYGAEPGDGTSRIKVDSTGSGGHLKADVEGLTLYYGSNGTGYLLASNQGNNNYVIYRREGNNSYVGTFSIPSGNGIDGTSDTDGIDVTNFGLGAAFPFGVFVVQDGSNSGGNQNYKLVPWEGIAATFGLITDTSWDPRAIGGNGSGPFNQAPFVDAGSNQNITWPNDTVNLNGTVSDDGQPPGGALTSQWSATGPASVSFGDATAEDTSTTFSVVGDYVLTMTASDGELSGSSSVNITVKPEPDPNSLPAIPGRIEVEDYNEGGQGITYNDTTTGNAGNVYRADDVDIQKTDDASGGYNVVWIRKGEWMAYDVNVQQTGDYQVTARIALGFVGNQDLPPGNGRRERHRTHELQQRHRLAVLAGRYCRRR